MYLIKKLEIKKLFGFLNYNLVFSEEKDFLRIITAPNGYGKSTILRVIEKFSKNDFLFFIHLNFDQIVFHLSNLENPIVIKKIPSDEKTSSKKMGAEKRINEITISKGEDELVLDSEFFDFISKIDNFLPIVKVGEAIWETFDENSTLGLFDVLEKFKDNISIKSKFEEFIWLFEITKKLDIFYIPTNRLIKEVRINNNFSYQQENYEELTIFDLQRHIKYDIQKSLKKQFQEGRYRESSFANRLLKKIDTGSDIDVASINRSIIEINKLEEKFNNLGILKKHKESNLDNIHELLGHIHDNTGLKILSVYLNDIVKKLERLDYISPKLELFKETIDGLFAFKKLNFSLDKGFEMFSTIHKNKEQEIELSLLSSGEQHLIILIGKLIFEANKNTLVLIDEPEISFHPEWQEMFIDILNKIKKVNNFSIIISTHSPYLINGNWECVIELAELI
ncbi:AAA family ATPase [Pasteurella multocida]|uniref:AAA family ATPase n=1 Tax=Pasteurella multocida TaxID=747 RepID=UPI00397B28B0